MCCVGSDTEYSTMNKDVNLTRELCTMGRRVGGSVRAVRYHNVCSNGRVRVRVYVCVCVCVCCMFV